MSLEPDEKELEKIRKNKAKADLELEELSPEIKAKKYVGPTQRSKRKERHNRYKGEPESESVWWDDPDVIEKNYEQYMEHQAEQEDEKASEDGY